MDVVLYDTTLRDGAQRAGISYTVSDKMRIARRLDELGFAYVEGGWPGSNPKDAEFFRAMRASPLRRARLVAFSSTRRAGVRVEEDPLVKALLEAGTPTVCIVGKAWTFHVTRALGVSREENLAMVRDTVAYLKRQGREVVFDAEHFFDGFKEDPEYALAVARAAAEAGADWVVLCDTNGGTLPHQLAEVVRAVRQALPVPLGIHCHDDSGVAVANSLAAVQEGCTMVQGTINGYGERCGNANLITIAANLQLKMGRRCLPDGSLSQLTSLSRFVGEVANLSPREEAPYVGRNAFAHKAGIHVSALLKHPAMYEHVPPEAVGNQRRVLVSELSGRANLVYAFRDRGLDGEELEELLRQVKELEYAGYQFEGAEASLELLLRDRRGGGRHFTLEGFRVTVEQRADAEPVAEATVKIRVGSRVIHTAAEGNGPVNALDAALRKALRECFPHLDRVRLVDYKVRVLEGDAGTGARVRVWVESSDGQRTWTTVGVSTNILAASWRALADSLEYFLQTAEVPGGERAAGSAGG